MTFEEYYKTKVKLHNRIQVLKRKLKIPAFQKNVNEIEEMESEIALCYQKIKELSTQWKAMTQPDPHQIVKLYNLGFSASQIGLLHGVSPQTIHSKMRDANLEKLSFNERNKQSLQLMNYLIQNNIEF